jgi:hypothetical protein
LDKWIYLDPNLTKSSLGIQGYVGNLPEILRDSIAYIVDDIGLIAEEKRYEDFDDHTGGISPTEGQSLTYAILEFLWSFLVPGGILTTSSEALNQLNDEEKQSIRDKYEIKFCPKANAKPGSDLAFYNGPSDPQSIRNHWQCKEMLYLSTRDSYPKVNAKPGSDLVFYSPSDPQINSEDGGEESGEESSESSEDGGEDGGESSESSEDGGEDSYLKVNAKPGSNVVFFGDPSGWKCPQKKLHLREEYNSPYYRFNFVNTCNSLMEQCDVKILRVSNLAWFNPLDRTRDWFFDTIENVWANWKPPSAFLSDNDNINMNQVALVLIKKQ